MQCVLRDHALSVQELRFQDRTGSWYAAGVASEGDSYLCVVMGSAGM